MGRMARYFELSRSSEGHNVRPMEGMPGFAVFLVFLVHYATLMSPQAKKGTDFAAILEWVHSVGNADVDLFFVLTVT
jgi:peptidoglycan/LPS O-acetylase OafA/YrhL